MDRKSTQYQGYYLAAGLGAIAGGLIIAVATRAIPKMMAKMMAGMMENMMAQMGEGDCNPADI
jgi:hypothetical protein